MLLYSALPDDPDLWWPAETIEELVRDHVKRWEIDVVSLSQHTTHFSLADDATLPQVITFDEYGVSGHSNHRAVSSALA